MEYKCKNCKFWTGFFVDGHAEPNACMRIMSEEEKECADLVGIHITTDYPEFIDFVCLNTDPEFGCILWEEKKEIE